MKIRFGLVPVLAVAFLAGVGCAAEGDASDLVTRNAAMSAAQCSFFATDGKVTVCHRTRSNKKGYRVQEISIAACVSRLTAQQSEYVGVGDPLCNGSGCFPPGAPSDGSVACCDGAGVDGGACQCLPGYAGAEGVDGSCEPCAAGSVAAGSGNESCTVCGAREWDAGDSETCEPCTACDVNGRVASACTSTTDTVCECDAGFEGDGFACVDIDECAGGDPVCALDATCTNRVGSFDCACNAGYSGDGFACMDIDECATGADDCDGNATCTNTAGGFTCACDAGYEGDGVTCTAVVQCDANSDDSDPCTTRDPLTCEQAWTCLTVAQGTVAYTGTPALAADGSVIIGSREVPVITSYTADHPSYIIQFSALSSSDLAPQWGPLKLYPPCARNGGPNPIPAISDALETFFIQGDWNNGTPRGSDVCASIFSHEMSDGSLNWNTQPGGPHPRHPISLSDTHAFYGGYNGVIRKFEQVAGAIEATMNLAGGNHRGGDIVLLGSGDMVATQNGIKIQRYTPAGGTAVWTSTAIQGSGLSVTTHDEILGWGPAPDYSNLVKLNPDTGAVIWSRPVTGRNRAALSDAAGNLYIGTADGAVSLDGAGNPRWETPLGANSLAQLLGDDGRFYVATPASLFALEMSTGAVAWRMDAHPDPVMVNGTMVPNTFSHIATLLAGGDLFIGDHGGRRYRLDLNIGYARAPWARPRGNQRNSGRVWDLPCDDMDPCTDDIVTDDRCEHVWTCGDATAATGLVYTGDPVLDDDGVVYLAARAYPNNPTVQLGNYALRSADLSRIWGPQYLLGSSCPRGSSGGVRFPALYEDPAGVQASLLLVWGEWNNGGPPCAKVRAKSVADGSLVWYGPNDSNTWPHPRHTLAVSDSHAYYGGYNRVFHKYDLNPGVTLNAPAATLTTSFATASNPRSAPGGNVSLASNGDVITATTRRSVARFTPAGSKVWETSLIRSAIQLTEDDHIVGWDSENQSTDLIVANFANGSERWRRSVPGNGPHVVLTDADGHLYLGYTDGARSYTSAGDLRWTVDLDARGFAQFLADDGRFYVQTSTRLHAIDMANGSIAWTFEVTAGNVTDNGATVPNAFSLNASLLQGGDILLGDSAGRLYRLPTGIDYADAPWARVRGNRRSSARAWDTAPMPTVP